MKSAPSNVSIRPADLRDITRLSEVLADAFLIAPVGDWLIPDLGHRRTVYLKYFSIFVEYGLDYGIVDVTDDLSGVAIWIPRDDDHPPIPDYDARLAAACGRYTDRFQVLDQTFTEQHPQLGFHHYLMFIGIRAELLPMQLLRMAGDDWDQPLE